jgi:hypothetical protein
MGYGKACKFKTCNDKECKDKACKGNACNGMECRGNARLGRNIRARCPMHLVTVK